MLPSVQSAEHIGPYCDSMLCLYRGGECSISQVLVWCAFLAHYVLTQKVAQSEMIYLLISQVVRKGDSYPSRSGSITGSGGWGFRTCAQSYACMKCGNQSPLWLAFNWEVSHYNVQNILYNGPELAFGHAIFSELSQQM